MAADIAPALGTSPQVLIARNDESARDVVWDGAQSLGIAPLDIGGLWFARSPDEMAFLNITLDTTKSSSWPTAWQLVGPRA